MHEFKYDKCWSEMQSEARNEWRRGRAAPASRAGCACQASLVSYLSKNDPKRGSPGTACLLTLRNPHDLGKHNHTFLIFLPVAIENPKLLEDLVVDAVRVVVRRGQREQEK